jgi:hypothetical protein
MSGPNLTILRIKKLFEDTKFGFNAIPDSIKIKICLSPLVTCARFLVRFVVRCLYSSRLSSYMRWRDNHNFPHKNAHHKLPPAPEQRTIEAAAAAAADACQSRFSKSRNWQQGELTLSISKPGMIDERMQRL